MIDIQLVAPVVAGRSSGSNIYDSFGNDDWDPVVAIGLNLGMVVAVTVASLLIVQTITGEKKDKLLGRMRIMGLSESAYWFTWFLTYLAIALVVALFIRKLLTPSISPVFFSCYSFSFACIVL